MKPLIGCGSGVSASRPTRLPASADIHQLSRQPLRPPFWFSILTAAFELGFKG